MDVQIRDHLREVVRTLRAHTADATGRRAALLGVLEAYTEAGRYPRWERPVRRRARRSRPPLCFDAPGPRSPRFRDDDGTWCAVGHLMAATDPALAHDIARRFEPCWLDEIDDPRVGAWAAAHGFTTDELAFVQPSYCFQPPVCDDVVIEEVRQVQPRQDCDGADLRFQTEPVYCQHCDGPFQVWVNVENRGRQSTEAAVELWGPVGVLDHVPHLELGPGEAVQVVLTTASVEDVGTGGGVRLVADADCDPVGNQLQLWDSGNGGGWVLPDQCGGRCDDGGPFGGRGCASTGLVTPGGLLVGLALVARHGRRRRGGPEA